MVIWITGLSGAGKTTLGRAVFSQWQAIAPNTVLVDGDAVRELFKLDKNPGLYSLEGRRMVAMRIHELCAWLDHQDINIVCCTISLFDELHKMNRAAFQRYFEVFVDVPMEILQQRDKNNLYAPAISGEISNVVGIDLPFSEPESPDLRLDNSGNCEDFGPFARTVLTAAGVL